MNLLIAALRFHTPEMIRRGQLSELVKVTADALDCPAPDLDGLSGDECLRRYAMFTRDQVEAAIVDGRDLRTIHDRLYAAAFRIGRKLRRRLRIVNTTDAMAAAHVLYRGIGIDLRGSPDGDVRIASCFFSDFYSPRVCRVMSAFDDGFMAGLAGGGRLIFLQRITDGHNQCHACFVREECST